MPAFTWTSTANVVEHLGGRVIFCDISLDNFNIDIEQMHLNKKNSAKAILPVHLFGFPADMESIIGLSIEHDLLVIEDAACGFGSKIKESMLGILVRLVFLVFTRERQ